jgi:hypothetical protein
VPFSIINEALRVQNQLQVIPPPPGMKGAHVSSMEQYREMYKRSLEDPDGFWSDMAKVPVALLAGFGLGVWIEG